MTQAAASAQIDALCAKASSASTCTPGVVQTWKTLLFADKLEQERHTEVKKATRPTFARSKSTKSTNARPQTAEKSTTSLSFSQKQKIEAATTLANAMLSVLTTAARTLTNERDNSTLTKPQSLPQQDVKDVKVSRPLREISSNPRTKTSPLSADGKIPRQNPNPKSIVFRQAQCACLAFQCLADARPVDEQASPSLQIELGLSALAHKLIAFEFWDLACSQLRRLSLRLYQYRSSARTQSIHAVAQKQSSVPAEPSLSEMLNYEFIDFDHLAKDRLSLIITTQMQVLRVVNCTWTNCDAEVAIQNLICSPSAPRNLILQQASRSDIELVKTQKSLSGLRQILIALADKVSLPAWRFQLKVLALLCQMDVSIYRAHYGNDVKSAIRFFIELMETFHSEAKFMSKAEVKIAQDAWCSISTHDFLKEMDPIATLPVCLEFEKMSLRANMLDEAHEWSKRAEGLSNRDVSLTSRLIISSLKTINALSEKSDALILERPKILQEFCSTIKVASEEVAKLTSACEFVQEALLQVCKVRHTTCSLIVRHLSNAGADSLSLAMLTNILDHCLEFLACCAAASTGSDEDQDGSKITGYRNLLQKLAGSTISSVCALSSHLCRTSTELHSAVYLLMQRLESLIASLMKFTTSDLENDIQVLAEKLSESTWNCFSVVQNSLSPDSHQVNFLQMSLTFGEQSSKAYKQQHLPRKYHMLGQILRKGRSEDSARQVWRRSISFQLQNDDMQSIAALSHVKPISAILVSHPQLQSLFQSLQELLKCSDRKNCKSVLEELTTFYDDSALATDLRLFVLDCQFSISFQRCLVLHRTRFDLTSCATIAARILELSTKDGFLLTRAHTLSCCLAIANILPSRDLLMDAANDILQREFRLDGSDGTGGFVAKSDRIVHEKSITEVFLNIAQIEKRPDRFIHILNSWDSLLASKQSEEDLNLAVYDVKTWASQIEIVSNQLEQLGLDHLVSRLLQMLARIDELCSSKELPNAKFHRDLILAEFQFERGFTAVGQEIVAKHDSRWQCEKENLDQNLYTRWMLLQSKLALHEGNGKLCHDLLAELRSRLQIEPLNDKKVQGPVENHPRIILLFRESQVDLLEAKHTFMIGRLEEAVRLARLSSYKLRKLYASTQKTRSPSWLDIHSEDRIMHEPRMVENDKVRQDEVMSQAHSSQRSDDDHHAESALSRSLLCLLFEAMIFLSQTFLRAGMYSESKYYCEESAKLAKRSGCVQTSMKHTMMQCQIQLHLNNLPDADRLCQAAMSRLVCSQFSVLRVQGLLMQAQIQIALGLHQDSQKSTLEAQRLLMALQSQSSLTSPSCTTSITIEQDLSSLTLNEPEKPGIPKKKSRSTQGKHMKPRIDTVLPKVSKPAPLRSIHALESSILLQRAKSQVQMQNLDKALHILDDTILDSWSSRFEVILLRAQIAREKFCQALMHNPLYGILLDSTLGVPMRCIAGSGVSKTIPEKEVLQRSRSSKTEKVAMQTGSTTIPPSCLNAAKLNESLANIMDLLSQCTSIKTRAKSMLHQHEISNMMAWANMIQSALSGANLKVPNLLNIGFLIEQGRLGAWETNVRLSTKKIEQISVEGLPSNPSSDSGGETMSSEPVEFGLRVPEFHRKYIDILPPSWHVISIGLSHAKDALVLSKIRHDHCPVVFHLPFQRYIAMNGDKDDETAAMTFHEAHQKIEEIARLANETSRSAKSIIDKKARTTWWAERTRLDRQLGLFLEQLQSVWFGGFRGLLSPVNHPSDLLSRFSRSLEIVLDKHLASRQHKRGRMTNHVQLGLNVAELFVGLHVDGANGANIESEVEELLFFVVETLQLGGEQNALDEIDFDAMVIEVIDALRQYHQAHHERCSKETTQESHIVLVLDKHLHIFPWESLPCLRGKAICRVPSLACLKDRIESSHKSNQSTPGACLTVQRNRGFCLLNPSGDLTNTQNTFKEPLQALQGWNGMINHEPSEEDMKSFHTDYDVFLYFGHGSGGQYIRGRNIKQLDSCAVALLMGCSSGALNEAGGFETYGTVLNYLQGNCPAVLATLWDVTDKDIDRFSTSVLEKWGLFDDPANVSSTCSISRTGKGKPAKRGPKATTCKASRPEESETGSSTAAPSVSLDAATGQSRDSCILKYLTGAAPVVYGVPVMLK